MSSDTERIQLISRGLYRIVSEVIGHEHEIKLRREKIEIGNILMNSGPLTNGTYITSGSQAEGFTMKTSDLDVMDVLNDVLVLPSYHPLPQGFTPQTCVLIYDTDYTSPGFAVMRCRFLDEFISTHTQLRISRSLVWNSLGPCVCSKLFREFYLGFFSSHEIHGPCISYEIMNNEFDIAFCLQCSYWPREASSFITRSLRSGWPSKQVVADICNDGCLFVPISSKALHCQDAVEIEWRMSFSLAEKKLVHSMNHCQFLCYGLLKIFLNDVLKKTEDIDGLLCSYFMKTAVFWEISESKSGWTLQNFLCKFWKTFCRLLGWVHVGYCPNFFNPDNNMFAGKIHGLKQVLLMQSLRSFHSEGVLCLLKCSSLNLQLTRLLQQTMTSRQLNIDSYILLPLSEELFMSKWQVEIHKIKSILLYDGVSMSLKLSQVFRTIRRIRNVKPVSTLLKATFKYGENKLLLRIGEIILEKLSITNYRSINNKRRKQYLRTTVNIFSRNGTTFCEREIIIAKWFYMLDMFQNAIQILSCLKMRLHCSQFMYEWTINKTGLERLHRLELSYNSFIKFNIANRVILIIGNSNSELLLELWMGFNYVGLPALFIPPLVFINFLLLLSYHHLGDLIRCNDILSDLHALVWYDEDYHIYHMHRAISWEILGICQQLCGDYHGAYQSYINALNDTNNYFKSATIIRICCTISQQVNA